MRVDLKIYKIIGIILFFPIDRTINQAGLPFCNKFTISGKKGKNVISHYM